MSVSALNPLKAPSWRGMILPFRSVDLLFPFSSIATSRARQALGSDPAAADAQLSGESPWVSSQSRYISGSLKSWGFGPVQSLHRAMSDRALRGGSTEFGAFDTPHAPGSHLSTLKSRVSPNIKLRRPPCSNDQPMSVPVI